MPSSVQSFEVVLVGGGLANALLALALLQRSPRGSVALIEAGTRLGGNHTWSFHEGDLPSGARSYVEPLMEYRWPSYEVRFPSFVRRVDLPYASFTSARLHECVERVFSQAPHAKLFLGRRSARSDANSVVMDDGSTLTADLVVDGRGPERFEAEPASRFQKFLGLEVSLRRPSPVSEPILMDACVSQNEGLRFVYVLPFTPERVLIEDTYFSDTPDLDEGKIERRIRHYAEANGFAVDQVLRREVGVLPLPTYMPQAPAESGSLASGYGGGWFHPTTGYSFPAALQLAEFVRTHGREATSGPAFSRLMAQRTRQQRYFCLLNRLLYGAFAPERRVHVFERFYGMPAPTISRFYAMQTSAGDRARILCGRPPRGLSLTRVFFKQPSERHPSAS
ncbi:MAG TPA: lycopene beta-cyclase CrtY [Polyangiaceae bacterium]|nr:lycopene beta-cyclase CrtY [Polyangiaceae bacterium]